MLCQDVQKLYLKRKAVKHGNRWWAMITYGKYIGDDYRKYSLELEECLEDDVPDMLDKFEVGYDELRLPDFASPLKAEQFGHKIMMQSGGAEGILYGKQKHS